MAYASRLSSCAHFSPGVRVSVLSLAALSSLHFAGTVAQHRLGPMAMQVRRRLQRLRDINRVIRCYAVHGSVPHSALGRTAFSRGKVRQMASKAPRNQHSFHSRGEACAPDPGRPGHPPLGLCGLHTWLSRLRASGCLHLALSGLCETPPCTRHRSSDRTMRLSVGPRPCLDPAARVTREPARVRAQRTALARS
jgi:hypothetical protein